jgi:hypothetical protein
MSHSFHGLQLTEYYKAHRDNFNENFRLRIHRALSWLTQAEQAKELDFKFISLWIAFNAAYAREIDDIQLGEKAAFNEFIMRICALDEHHQIYDLIWQKFSGSIRLLLDNQYIFQPFWDFHNGKISEMEWEKAFFLAKNKLLYALEEKKTDKVLNVLFQRLYTLRNQILHGGSTFNSRVNRDQVKDSCNILSFLIPSMLEIMMKHHNEIEWGKPFYPVVK